MSQVLNNDSLHPRVQDKFPAGMSYGHLPASNSMIVDRKTVKDLPVSGSVFGTTNASLRQIQFRINSPDLIDPNTVRLEFFHKCSRVDQAEVSPNATVQIDDFAHSLIDNIVVKVSSQEIERVDEYGVLANALSYYSMPQQYYRNQAAVNEGAYKFAADSVAANTEAQARARDGSWYSIPLTAIGLFRQKKFLPPNLDIMLEINLDSFAKSHKVGSTNGQNVDSPYDAFSLEQVRLCMDTVSVFADWYGHYDRAIQSASGISLPIETFELVPQVVTNPNGSYAISKGAKDLITVLTLFRKSATLASSIFYSKSTFERMNLKGYQYKLANKSYPQDPTNNFAEMFNESQKGFNQLGSIDAGGIVDKAYFTGTDGDSGSGLFLIAQNLQNSMESIFSGQNTKSQGYQLNFYWQNRVAGSDDPSDQGAYANDNPSSTNSYQASNYMHMIKIVDLRDGRLYVSS